MVLRRRLVRLWCLVGLLLLLQRRLVGLLRRLQRRLQLEGLLLW